MIPNHHAAARALACAALALHACAAAARTTTPAADPKAAVPAVRYDDAIGYRVAPAPQARPDQTWVQSNATVAGIDAMSLTMKGIHGAMPRSMPPMPPMPAPAPSTEPAGAAHDHAHMQMHDHADVHDHAGMHGAMPTPAEHRHAEDR